MYCPCSCCSGSGSRCSDASPPRATPPAQDGSAVPVKTELDSAGRVSDTLPLDHPERPGHTYTGNADGVGFFDPRPFSGGTAPRVTIRELPVQRISVGFPPQDMTALNGPTRVIPKTMASHDPIPSLAEECDRRLLPAWLLIR